MSVTLKDTYSGTANYSLSLASGRAAAQTFVATSSHYIYSIKLLLYRVADPGTVTISVRSGSNPTGADLCYASMSGVSITTDTAGAWYEFVMNIPYKINTGNTYSIIMKATSGGLNIKGRDDNPYSNGKALFSFTGGSSWSDLSGVDFFFEMWGEGTSGNFVFKKKSNDTDVALWDKFGSSYFDGEEVFEERCQIVEIISDTEEYITGKVGKYCKVISLTGSHYGGLSLTNSSGILESGLSMPTVAFRTTDICPADFYGQVLIDGLPLENVQIDITGETSVLTNGSGNFEKHLIYPAPWSGTITPSKEGYLFVPSSYSFSSIFWLKFSLDFVATGDVYPPKAINPTPAIGAENVDWSLKFLTWQAGS